MNQEVLAAKKEILLGLAWGGGIVLLALGATLARKLGYIDQDMVVRLTVGISGLMVASYGNRMPKTLVNDACGRRATRVGGWAFVLSGLIYAGLWAFAPIKVAGIVGTAAVAAGLAVTIGYALWLRARARVEGNQA